MAHAAFVRSAVARGRIVGLDVSEARRAPGVLAVLTAAEINSRTHMSGRGPTDRTPRRVLADGDVRYVGDPVAMVVAESRYLAEDAAELVSVDIEPDDPVVTAAQALAEGSPRVHPELPDNLAGVIPAADLPELDKLLDECAARVHRDVPPAPLRVRADGDPRHGRPVGSVGQAAGADHRRAGRARRRGCSTPGCWACPRTTSGSSWAMSAGRSGRRRSRPGRSRPWWWRPWSSGDRPVKWIEDRAENLISGGHAREESLQITAATDENGVLLAARAHHLENVGAYPSGGNGQKAGLASSDVPRALPLVRPRFGGATPGRRSTRTRAGCARTGGRG